jgi:hypothetical protein
MKVLAMCALFVAAGISTLTWLGFVGFLVFHG